MAALFFPLVVQPPGAACRGSCLYFCPLPAEQLPGRAVLALPAHTAAFWVRALLPRARQRGYFWPWCPAWPLCCFLTRWELQVWQPLSHFPTPAPFSPARLSLEAFGGATCPLAAPGGALGAVGGPCSPRCSPSQRLDRGAVRAAREPGRGHHHDGGGGVLHALRRPLALPPQAGEFLAGLGAAQAPCGASLGGIAWPGGPPRLIFSPPAPSPRCTPCIAARAPASKGRRRSFPKASSPTGASRTQRPGRPPRPHTELSGGISPSWGAAPASPPLPPSPPPPFSTDALSVGTTRALRRRLQLRRGLV